jgi:pimeloyl-ACP methyl ester carboxylesterase
MSLTSIMSTTGAKRLGRPTIATYARLYRPVPDDRDAAVDQGVSLMRHIGSRGFPFDGARARAVLLEAWERDGGPNSDGPARQLAAIFKSGDRTEEVRRIAVPTLVIHGDHDPMVNPTGGWATARAIQGPRPARRGLPGTGRSDRRPRPHGGARRGGARRWLGARSRSPVARR